MFFVGIVVLVTALVGAQAAQAELIGHSKTHRPMLARSGEPASVTEHRRLNSGQEDSYAFP